MRAWDIVGWVWNAAVYCAGCKPARGCEDRECQDSECCPQPIFASDEPDPADHCDECRESIWDL